MKPCQCFVGRQCDGMPNRFRKVLNEKTFWQNGTCEQSTIDCDLAVKSEFGSGFEGAWCLSMTPVILSR